MDVEGLTIRKYGFSVQVTISSAIISVVVVAGLAVGKYELIKIPDGVILTVAVLFSVINAGIVGWQGKKLPLAWLVTAIIMFPIAWVLSLGGPPGQPFRLFNTLFNSLLLVMLFSSVVGTSSFVIGHGLRLLIPQFHRHIL